MIKLKTETIKAIEEYAKLNKEVKDFEAQIATHEQEAEDMRTLQAEAFDFERAKELNMLETIISQAKESLEKRKQATQKQREARKLKLKIANEIGGILEADDELLKIEADVMKKVDSILEEIAEYRTLFKFKQEKLQQGVMELSNENLRGLVSGVINKSEFAPFRNRTLERAIKTYKTPEKENI